MRGLDTNVLMRYVTEDDPVQFATAAELLVRGEDRGERFYVHSVVLCELAWVLRGGEYRYRRRAIAEAIEKLLEIPLFEVQSRDQVVRALADFRNGPGDFADYLIGWTNVDAGCDDTVTFDRRLDDCEAFSVLDGR